MKIACIGWGSLIWDKRGLKTYGGWNEDGPLLPIEFARQSKDGRITLVIEEKSSWVNSLWIFMSTENLDDAIESLKIREGTTKKNIHFQTMVDKPPNKINKSIYDWLFEKKIDAAIWTGLPPKFNNKNITPTISDLLKYFDTVSQEILQKSAEYIFNTPTQINTEYRKELEQKLARES